MTVSNKKIAAGFVVAKQYLWDGVASVAANAGSEPGASRAFLERALSAMEGVIDVADRNTTEFDALQALRMQFGRRVFEDVIRKQRP